MLWLAAAQPRFLRRVAKAPVIPVIKEPNPKDNWDHCRVEEIPFCIVGSG